MDHSDQRRIAGFSAQQYYAAFRLIMPDEEASAEVEKLLAALESDPRNTVGLDRDGLTLLSLTSSEVAKQVRVMLRETPEEAALRQERFLETHPLRRSADPA